MSAAAGICLGNIPAQSANMASNDFDNIACDESNRSIHHHRMFCTHRAGTSSTPTSNECDANGDFIECGGNDDKDSVSETHSRRLRMMSRRGSAYTNQAYCCLAADYHSGKADSPRFSSSALSTTIITDENALDICMGRRRASTNITLKKAPYSYSSCYCFWTTKLALLFTLLTIVALGPRLDVSAAKANEIEIDWTLESNLFNKADWITTKYVRMKDVLHFRCASVIAFNIFMVPAESAYFCKLPAVTSSTSVHHSTPPLRQPIGVCAPNTGDPKVNIRTFSPLPDRPTFHEGRAYFLITTSTGTSDGVENAEGGLCQSHGMRMRLMVLGAAAADDADGRPPPDELTSFAEIFPNLRQLPPPVAPTNPAQIRTLRPPKGLRDLNGHLADVSAANAETDFNAWSNNPPSSQSLRHTGAQRGSTTSSRRGASASSASSASLAAECAASALVSGRPPEDGFPAILTLEDAVGGDGGSRERRICVHNAAHLQREINAANARHNRVHHFQQFHGANVNNNNGRSANGAAESAERIPERTASSSATKQHHLPEYSVSGYGEIDAIPMRFEVASTSGGSHRNDRYQTWQQPSSSRRQATTGGRGRPESAASYKSNAPADDAFTFEVGYNSAEDDSVDSEAENMNGASASALLPSSGARSGYGAFPSTLVTVSLPLAFLLVTACLAGSSTRFL